MSSQTAKKRDVVRWIFAVVRFCMVVAALAMSITSVMDKTMLLIPTAVMLLSFSALIKLIDEILA
jgi:hypothetical protein